MKQSLFKNSDHQSSDKQKDFKVNRTDRLKKYRDARKQKSSVLISENMSEECKTNSKGEKIEIKKLRNREAAQRARDRAKLYTIELEKQLEALKMEIVLLRDRQFVCYKCNESSGGNSSGNTNEYVDSVDEYFFEEEKIEELEPMFEGERVKNNHGFSFPMFLMVVAIVLCLFSTGKEEVGNGVVREERRPHRLLQEIVNVSQYDQFTNMRTKVYPHKQSHSEENTEIKTEGRETNSQHIPEKPLEPSRIELEPSSFKVNSVPADSEHINRTTNVTQNRDGIKQIDYDVLFCDESRIYRYRNQKNSREEREIKIIINKSHLEEIEDWDGADGGSDSYETMARISKVYNTKL